NGFPVGKEELDPTALRSIRVEGKSGPAEMPAGALVSVTGCLSQGPGNTWMLTHAGKLTRVRDGANYPAGELQALDAPASGSETVPLMDAAFYDPETKKDRKVAAKGLLIRNNGEVRVNLIVLQPTGSACGQ